MGPRRWREATPRQQHRRRPADGIDSTAVGVIASERAWEAAHFSCEPNEPKPQGDIQRASGSSHG
jgi:hypothetical protein